MVIPTYNEAANLPHTLALLPQDVEVVVADGHSTDGTVAVVQALRPDAVIVQLVRRGRGNALVCGFAAATGDVIITLDADGSADPREIPSFVEALLDGADVAEGTRFKTGGSSNDLTVLRGWGARGLSRAASLLFGLPRTDLCYGYTAIWASCLPALELTASRTARGRARVGDGFDFAAVLKARVAKAGLRVVEVPSTEHRRRWGESNLDTWRDGGRVLRALLLERFATAGTAPRSRP